MFIVLALLLIICIFFISYVKWENSRFRVTHYTLYSDKIPEDITIVQLSDLHNYEYGTNNCTLMEAIEKENPDIVISSGDMIEAGRLASQGYQTITFLGELCEKFEFVYGCGNHELRLLRSEENPQDMTNKRAVRAFHRGLTYVRNSLSEKCPHKASSIIPLDNANIKKENLNVKIYGLNLEQEYFRKVKLLETTAEHIESLVGKKDENAFNILIGHNPDQIKAYSGWGADLVLSGHVHGGMIALPNGRGIVSPQFTLFPKYYAGIYKEDNTYMAVSRGLGNHTIHIRIFNRAELVVIHLKKDNS